MQAAAAKTSGDGEAVPGTEGARAVLTPCGPRDTEAQSAGAAGTQAWNLLCGWRGASPGRAQGLALRGRLEDQGSPCILASPHLQPW